MLFERTVIFLLFFCWGKKNKNKLRARGLKKMRQKILKKNVFIIIVFVDDNTVYVETTTNKQKIA